MGESVKIVDLARDMIRLAGLEPDRDIEIRFTGIRPGEKLYEELSLDEEKATRTRHPRILIGTKANVPLSELRVQLDELRRRADSESAHSMRAMFKEIVPEYVQPVAERTSGTTTLPPDPQPAIAAATS